MQLLHDTKIESIIIMIPRDYQIRTLDEAWEAMQYQHNVLIVAPCSAGKTILFSKLIQRLLRENPSFRALILVDREILVTQSANKLRKVAPELAASIGIVCASVSNQKDYDLPVTIASRQSLAGNLDRFPPVQMVIVDEAHLMAVPSDTDPIPDQYAKIIGKLREYNPAMRMVGCTASPYRLGVGYIHGNRNKPGCIPYWSHVDSTITTKELLAGGYIAPLIGRIRASDTLATDLQNVSMVGSDFNLGQLSDVMMKVVHVQSCVDAYREYASDRKKTLVFGVTIEHASAVADAFKAADIEACAIHSKLSPVELSARMTALEAGTMPVFTSVAKLTTGMDVVDIDCIILARPTKSTALFQQIVGRGQRLSEGKTDCLVIDLVGATREFGTDMDNLKVNIPTSAGGQGIHASLRYCPHCSYEFPSGGITDGDAGPMKEVKFNERQPPETWDVTGVKYRVHTSRTSGKDMIRVIYECGGSGMYREFSEYICLPDFYDGYAVTKARKWWEERTGEAFPENIDEFIFLSGTLEEPAQIVVDKDGKFDRIIEHKWEREEDEGEPFVPDLSGDVPF